MESATVLVTVSSELLAKLGDWSAPVQVRIEKLPDGTYDMIARTHQCEKEEQ